ncbi:MAG: glycosyltransferase family protein [Dysgonamonadaceae bacterium]|jgi:GT2 family glycosyltransferase|nr:glycosyltransferase family protein [Dysgonamonadaceae bacterium]
MVSIIICTKQGRIPESLKSSIKDTIGVPYELVIIDNSKNEYSIFEAYNEGIKKASYNLLCFMHEDIWYHSQDWGKSIVAHLSIPEVGLIGLAGAYYLLSLPSTWFKAKPCVMNLIQTSYKHYSIKEDTDVICVDGFWFCSRKDVFRQVAFDEKNFRGFHFYDLDISMQIHEKGYSILVISDITVEHFSGGSLNRQWLDSAYIFYYKWKKQLPASLNILPKKKLFVNTKAFRDLLYVHKKNNCPVTKETLKIGWHTLKFNVLTACLLFYIKRSASAIKKKFSF